ncbi:MAG: UDP-4-amino-4,6-dideoxy-N-acetyl-beta-L-altrosamine transaminase [Bacteroidales bacterium]
MKAIPYGRQNITDEDIQAVIEVLKSDYLTQGPKIAEFEIAFAEYIGCKYAVAVSNGTAALHLSALALYIQPGDKIITTPITFAASANCVRYCGGEVVFADIDPTTYLLDINTVRKLLLDSPEGTYKGIIPVDFAGNSVNLEEYRQLADEFGLWIIEDACHAPGAYFTDTKDKHQICGNGNYADLAIFSFHPVKHIATGEGGMITTNDEILYKKLIMLRTHGITKEKDLFQNSIEFANGTRAESQKSNSASYAGWYYEMQDLGFNYRLTDFQAALGLSQLKRANIGLSRRKEIAQTYYNAFKDKSYIKGQSGFSEEHAYHLYIIEVNNRKGLYEYLHKNNVFAQIHYIPVHMMPYYRQLGWKEGDCPIAEDYYKHCISLPMYSSLKEDEQELVIKLILDFYIF